MPKLKKYIETHWLFYAIQGVVSLIFGGFIIFTDIHAVSELSAIIGVALLFLGVIEAFSLLYRKHFGGSLVLSLILAVSEVAIALLLLFTKDYNMLWPLVLLAIYTIGRGILEIILGFSAMTDRTDRFMWVVCGISATIIGIIIFNSGAFSIQTAFVQFFGSYMMIYGITNLFYGVHNRNELIKSQEERAAARKTRAIAQAKVRNRLSNIKAKLPGRRKKAK